MPQNGGQNEEPPTKVTIACVTPTVWEVRNAPEQGKQSYVAHKWADWLHIPCQRGAHQCLRVGDKISLKSKHLFGY